MVQSVALKRPRGGVRGLLFHVPGLGLALVPGVLCFTCPVAAAAPKFRLHCLGIACAARKAMLAVQSHAGGRGAHLDAPGAAGRTHILGISSKPGASCLRATAVFCCCACFNPLPAKHLNRNLGPPTFGHQPGPIYSSLSPGAHG